MKVAVLGALATALAFGGGYTLGRIDGRVIEEGTQAREANMARVATDAASIAAATAIAGIEVKHVTVKQRLETQIRTEPVYRDCEHDQRVFDDLNRALTGAEPAGDRQLPANGTDDGQVVRSHDGEAGRPGLAVPEVPGRSAGRH